MALNAFIIRPFGAKDICIPQGHTGAPGGETAAAPRLKRVDFDLVHRELIDPALRRLRIAANTTEAVIQAGNIREDMFHLLMTADLVVADITYHNPNVFYELGIRHAFRDRYTFLIRGDGQDDPFDLKTDRYFSYDYDCLIGSDQIAKSTAIERLANAIRATISSERTDSPIFRLMPGLESEERSRFIAVPTDFLEAVERAQKMRRRGDLQLLAMESEGFLWEVEGHRAVGRSQFELNFVHDALSTWEEIVRRYPNDVEANMILSTIYQRINDYTRSDQALARISRLNIPDMNTVAELRALVGRNYKYSWTESWHPELQKLEEKTSREGACSDLEIKKRFLREKALRSPLLRKARNEYIQAYRENLNYTYAGLNALSLMLTEVSLAQEFPEVWKVLVDNGEDADAMLRQLKLEIAELSSALTFAMASERKRLSSKNQVDFWFEIMEAGFLCMTSPEVDRVRQAYREAIFLAPECAERDMRPALSQFRDLEIKHPDHPKVDIPANLDAALELIAEEEQSHRKGDIIIFVGLRMKPHWGRSKPLATASDVSYHRSEQQSPNISDVLPDRAIQYLQPEFEERALAEIKTILTLERDRSGGILFGMAAGSSGGDILFHESCAELDIASRLFLALPKDQYLGEYVAPAGPQWIDRFNKVFRRLVVQKKSSASNMDSGEMDADTWVNILADSPEMPRWLQSKSGYTVGKRNSAWMLQHALVQRHLHGADQTDITMIALWDRHEIHGTGGIGDLIKTAEKLGIKVIEIDCSSWHTEALRDIQSPSPGLKTAERTEAPTVIAINAPIQQDGGSHISKRTHPRKQSETLKETAVKVTSPRIRRKASKTDTAH